MSLPTRADDFKGLELPASRKLHLCLGMFDGVHLGHQAVIESAVHAAKRSGGIPAVLTFDPHPSRLFNPTNPTKLIQSPNAKLKVLGEIGVELVIVREFTKDFAAIPAEDFLSVLKEHMPTLAAIYVGENFRFGKKRAGDVGELIAQGKKLGVHIYSANRIKLDGQPISSTRIRTELAAGNISEANELLGYSYFCEGTVTAGLQNGGKLGFPTLNVPWQPELQPRFGVYAVRVSNPDGTNPQNGVANYGVKPTVGDDFAPCLETHVLGECPWSTGATIKVSWLHFIRPEKRFENLDALKEQIAKDKETATKFFS